MAKRNLILLTQRGNLYEIAFSYDPIVIGMIKAIPSRQWVPERKIWTIHKDYVGWLIKDLTASGYGDNVLIKSEEELNVNREIATTQSIPDIDISNIPFYVEEGSKPYQHQLDFMKYALGRQAAGYKSGFMVCDEQGLGKTIEALNLAMFNREKFGYKHCLIICCINGSKFNWKADIAKHTKGKEQPYILGTRYKRDGSEKIATGEDKLYDLLTLTGYGKKVNKPLPYFIVCNIETFRMRDRKSFPITDAIIHLINSGEIGMVIIDEIHKNASPSSLQGKQLIRIKQTTGQKAMWLPMTGTPIVNKPTDVYIPLMLVDGHNYTNYHMWCKQFCVYGGYGDKEIIGYKNIPMLKGMVEHNMIRRLKENVIDLPDKIYYDEYVENTKYQRDLYESIRYDLYANREQIRHSMNPLASIMKLRQVNGSPELVDSELKLDKSYLKKNAKMARLIELLAEIHMRGEKVLVFSNWVNPLRTLYKIIISCYKVCYFTGTMTADAREQQKQLFMTDPSYTVMVGTIGAMGTTHTLTAANNVIFLDEPWTPTDKIQAIDRAHRIGSAKPVNIYTLITRGTIDDKVHQIIYTKSGVSKYIVDNKLDIKAHPELVDLLLDKKEIGYENNMF